MNEERRHAREDAEHEYALATAAAKSAQSALISIVQGAQEYAAAARAAELGAPRPPGEAVAQAVKAAPVWAAAPREIRAQACEAIADALEDGDAIVSTAKQESHLPEPALRAELARTAYQWRFFADVVREGSYLEATIDHPTDTPMGPQPDLRRMLVPIGPVAVFGASNFPLAFSTAGGDTASALAVGCPVVVKTHPSHPRTSGLVGVAVARALASIGAPQGVFGSVEGFEEGVELVEHPDVRAVAFTGSLAGGRALQSRIAERAVPIPFYGELSSLNPVIVLPGAAAERGDEIAEGLVASYTVRGGQLCTKPGLAFVPVGDAGDIVVETAAEVTGGVAGSRLLTDGIAAAYVERTDGYAADARVRVVATGSSGADGTVTPMLLEAAAEEVSGDLLKECFGPTTLVVRYGSLRQVYAVLGRLGGSLTGTVHHGAREASRLAEVLGRLSPWWGGSSWAGSRPGCTSRGRSSTAGRGRRRTRCTRRSGRARCGGSSDRWRGRTRPSRCCRRSCGTGTRSCRCGWTGGSGSPERPRCVRGSGRYRDQERGRCGSAGRCVRGGGRHRDRKRGHDKGEGADGPRRGPCRRPPARLGRLFPVGPRPRPRWVCRERSAYRVRVPGNAARRPPCRGGPAAYPLTGGRADPPGWSGSTPRRSSGGKPRSGRAGEASGEDQADATANAGTISTASWSREIW